MAGMCRWPRHRWGGQVRREGIWHLWGCLGCSKSLQPSEAALGVCGERWGVGGMSEQWDVHECLEGRLGNKITQVKAWTRCWSPWNVSPQHRGHQGPSAWESRVPTCSHTEGGVQVTARPELAFSPGVPSFPGDHGQVDCGIYLNFSPQDHDQTS